MIKSLKLQMKTGPNTLVPLNQLIQNFLSHLVEQKNYSAHTAASYHLDLKKLAHFAHLKQCTVHNMDKSFCRDFLSYLATLSLEKSSVARLISSYRSFWTYLIDHQVVSLNPWTHIRLPKKDTKLPSIVSTSVILSFLDGIDTSTPIGLRNRTICECLYGIGLRVSELTQLTLANINFDDGICKILGKGNKERLALFGDITKTIMTSYLSAARPLWATSRHDNFIINTSGNPLSTRSVQRIIKSCCQAQGLSHTITPHTLRHCFATDLYKGGADLTVIKDLLGHRNLSTTEIYTHIANEDLTQTVHLSHPHGGGYETNSEDTS